MNWRIEPLRQTHVRGGFDCGDEALNRFIRQYDRQQQTRGLNCSYVALPAAGETVVGFYSLSAGSVAFSELDAALKLPRYPIPMARLGRLAVDRAWQGQGIGRALLAHAFQLIIALSGQIGIHAVVVDAKHEQAKAYYQRLGFIPCQDQPSRCICRSRPCSRRSLPSPHRSKPRHQTDTRSGPVMARELYPFPAIVIIRDCSAGRRRYPVIRGIPPFPASGSRCWR